MNGEFTCTIVRPENDSDIPCHSPAATVWGSKLPFNTICGEYASPAGGWVHAVGFSPSGDVLAFTSEPQTISLIHIFSNPTQVMTVP